jgi:enoyl-CoA hydratase/carnithine racemase
MEPEQITTDVSERVLTITLNRPERLNAWTAQMGRELIAALDRADEDDEVRAVIVTGAGRGFCAGADLQSGGDTFDYRAREH